MDAKNKASREPHVSIVDDDVSVRRSTRRLLRCCGLRAELLSSAEDFLQSGRVAETSCLLFDVLMPGMDGLGTPAGRDGVAAVKAPDSLTTGEECRR